MLSDLLNDRVTLVKVDGHVEREDIPSFVTAGKIMIQDETVPLEVGDHLVRRLKNGLAEDFVVEDPVFQSSVGGIDAFYNARVRRAGTPATQYQTVIKNITNNVSGPNARVNVNSTDNLTNTSYVTSEKLHGFLDQVIPVLGNLPEAERELMAEQIAVLQLEANNSEPAQMKVMGALQIPLF